MKITIEINDPKRLVSALLEAVDSLQADIEMSGSSSGDGDKWIADETIALEFVSQLEESIAKAEKENGQ